MILASNIDSSQWASKAKMLLWSWERHPYGYMHFVIFWHWFIINSSVMLLFMDRGILEFLSKFIVPTYTARLLVRGLVTKLKSRFIEVAAVPSFHRETIIILVHGFCRHQSYRSTTKLKCILNRLGQIDWLDRPSWFLIILNTTDNDVTEWWYAMQSTWQPSNGFL